MKILRKRKKGLTLIETGFVLFITMFAGFVSFSQILKDQETVKAGMAGSQIKQIGDSVNAYISNHYDTLSTLTNATGVASDLGPRTCTTSNNTCTITVATLVNEGLLPSTYSGKNVYGSGYSIILKRNGASPYYKINGMVTTSTPLIVGTNVRYDLLGHAMQKAGIDSGMTRSSSSTVSGYNGSWTASSTDYTNINAAGMLAYQAGYGTYNYSVFLRRDGTLPMTGNLNMGANSINNSVDYNGTGNINTGGKVIAGSEVSAKNGYGDVITMGGDAAGNDYEIRLGTSKPLTIYSPNATANSTVLSVGGNASVSGRLATNGISPNDVPSSWAGGIRTYDVLATGSIAVVKAGSAGSTGNWAAYLTNNGTLYASNNINSGDTITAAGNISGNGIYGNYLHSNGNIDAANDVNANHQVNTQYVWASGNVNSNYVHSNGDIRADGNVSGNGIYGNYVQSNGDVYSVGQTRSNGRMTTNELLQINGVVGENTGCSPNGLIGRTGEGKVVSCTNGVWKASGGGKSGYFCRLTSFDEHRSEDYVGYVPRTDKNCPVIYPGQTPQGYCSCIKIMLDY